MSTNEHQGHKEEHMVAELDLLSEWIPEQMQPGTVFVLENAGEIGEKEDPYWAVLSCPSCGMLGLITRKQINGLLPVICGSEHRSAQFFIRDSQVVVRKPFEIRGRSPRPSVFSCLYFLQLHWNLFDDFYAEAFERGHFFGTIGEQRDAAQVQIRQNLSTHANPALNLLFVVVQRRKPLPAMKADRGSFADLFDGKSLRGLVQVDQRSASFLRNAAQRAFQRGVAFAARRSKDVSHQAVRVHADQNRCFAMLDISANQSDV